jgi:hypothetical protein
LLRSHCMRPQAPQSNMSCPLPGLALWYKRYRRRLDFSMLISLASFGFVFPQQQKLVNRHITRHDRQFSFISHCQTLYLSTQSCGVG